MLDTPYCWSVPASRVSPRRATYFSLSRQRNLRKRKATRLSGSFRFAPGNLRCSIPSGGGRTRFAQTTAALDTASICAARPSQTGFREGAGFGEAGTRKARPRRSPLPIPARTPVALGRGAQTKADQGGYLSERSEFVPDPAFVEHRRLPRSAAQGSQTIGSPSLCLLSLGDARESESPAGARPGLQADHTARVSKHGSRIKFGMTSCRGKAFTQNPSAETSAPSCQTPDK